jgi:hypothetical protein
METKSQEEIPINNLLETLRGKILRD